MRGSCRASSSAWYSSSTVRGRKALRTSGRSNAMRAMRPVRSWWYVMSVKPSARGTSRQRVGSWMSETCFTMRPA